MSAPADTDLYLDLLKRALSGGLAEIVNTPRWTRAQCLELLAQVNVEFAPYLAPGERIESLFPGVDIVEEMLKLSRAAWPDTMNPMTGIENLQFCVEDVLERGVPGDLIETGVWKGGMTVFMRGILKAHRVTDRAVWVADSFAGHPKPDPTTDLRDAISWHLTEPMDKCKVSVDSCRELFRRYDLLDEQVRFLPGWFKDTLPRAPIERLAVARLDGDWYESTRDALLALYDKVSAGGYVIIDDYGFVDGCKRAVDEFRSERGISAPMTPVNDWTVFWQKP